MITNSPHLYKAEGIKLGVASGILDAAISGAGKVERRGLASVLTLNHLSYCTGASYPYLRGIITRQRDPYSDISIARRNGRKMRSVSSPEPTLLQVQQWILKRIVEKDPTHPSSYAYSPGKSVKQCASRHVGAKWLVKMDIRDFFESINEVSVYKVFRGFGYAPLPALELARVCTRYAGHAPRPGRFYVKAKRYAPIRAYSKSLLGFLPQGAPTSGALANHVAMHLDRDLSALAEANNLIYTRYADDVTFSSGEAFKRSVAVSILNQASAVVERRGFVVHRQKTSIVTPGARKVVLGLLVDGDRVRLTKKMRQRISLHVRGVEEFGFVDHARHMRFSSVDGLVLHVSGLIAYAVDIEPGWADNFAGRWRAVLARKLGIDPPSFGRRE
ncbi:reverse transcriptase family protein [Streptomyces sp. NPDC005820]|uniref:reverse transcriptase family protein n=1 Tax=Streptomyces sp. NPDC005820 TaxID=3157069 RepID=UPI0034101CBE